MGGAAYVRGRGFSVFNLALLIKGLGIGLAIAAPVGPIGVLCIRRTLQNGRLIGILSGLGAASADAVYGAVAAFGLSSIAGLLLDFERSFRVVGGVFLVLLGVRILVKAAMPTQEPPFLSTTETGGATGTHMAGAFVSCFLLTLTNPSTILSFLAIFAGLGLAGHAGDRGAAVSLVVGVFVGSALWWLVLSGSVGMLRGRMGPAAMVWINRLSGLIIAGFGLGVLAALVV
jgi:threonine/homoserine/homoserine lactone efflux protein